MQTVHYNWKDMRPCSFTGARRGCDHNGHFSFTCICTLHSTTKKKTHCTLSGVVLTYAAVFSENGSTVEWRAYECTQLSCGTLLRQPLLVYISQLQVTTGEMTNCCIMWRISQGSQPNISLNHIKRMPRMQMQLVRH